VTNPHTPADPRPRDESDKSAFDSMAKEGRWLWLMFALLALGTFIAWKAGLR